jgi:hypothetical protein
MMWLRQMAQLSTTISQAHRATAFHFLISNRLGRLATAAELALALVPSPDGPGKISISSDAITSHYSQLPHFPPYPPTPEHYLLYQHNRQRGNLRYLLLKFLVLCRGVGEGKQKTKKHNELCESRCKGRTLNPNSHPVGVLPFSSKFKNRLFLPLHP